MWNAQNFLYLLECYRSTVSDTNYDTEHGTDKGWFIVVNVITRPNALFFIKKENLTLNLYNDEYPIRIKNSSSDMQIIEPYTFAEQIHQINTVDELRNIMSAENKKESKEQIYVVNNISLIDGDKPVTDKVKVYLWRDGEEEDGGGMSNKMELPKSVQEKTKTSNSEGKRKKVSESGPSGSKSYESPPRLPPRLPENKEFGYIPTDMTASEKRTSKQVKRNKFS